MKRHNPFYSSKKTLVAYLWKGEREKFLQPVHDRRYQVNRIVVRREPWGGLEWSDTHKKHQFSPTVRTCRKICVDFSTLCTHCSRQCSCFWLLECKFHIFRFTRHDKQGFRFCARVGKFRASAWTHLKPFNHIPQTIDPTFYGSARTLAYNFASKGGFRFFGRWGEHFVRGKMFLKKQNNMWRVESCWL